MKSKLKPVLIKIHPVDLEWIQTKADMYAEGNLSAWMRHAARMHVPKKSEHVRLKAS